LKVILGLGNPGPRYAATRHNIGMDVVAILAQRWGIALSDQRDAFVGGAGQVAGTAVYLAVNRVYMNLSGQAAKSLWNKMGRQTDNLAVVHDDIDLPLGRVRLKHTGSDGGQRGVRSIMQTLGDREFQRIKVGVGRPQDSTVAVADFVLGCFTPDEMTAAEAGINWGANAIERLLRDGFLTAQAHIHSHT